MTRSCRSSGTGAKLQKGLALRRATTGLKGAGCSGSEGEECQRSDEGGFEELHCERNVEA